MTKEIMHHHHHHHHHPDESEIFKNRQLRSKKKRAKVFSKVLFTLGCILALLIIITVFWIYTNE